MDNINLIDINKIIVDKFNFNKENYYYGKINYFTKNNSLLLSLNNITLSYNLLYSFNTKYHKDKYDKNRFNGKIILNDYQNLNKLKEINNYILTNIINVNNLKFDNEVNNYLDQEQAFGIIDNKNALNFKLLTTNKKYDKTTNIKCNVKYKDNLFDRYKFNDCGNFKLIIDNINLNLFERIKRNFKINIIIEINNYWFCNNNIGLKCYLKEIFILDIPKKIIKEKEEEKNEKIKIEN